MAGQVLEAVSHVGRPCSPGVLAVDSLTWLCSLPPPRSGRMEVGMSNSSSPLPHPMDVLLGWWEPEARCRGKLLCSYHADFFQVLRRLGKKPETAVVNWPAQSRAATCVLLCLSSPGLGCNEASAAPILTMPSLRHGFHVTILANEHTHSLGRLETPLN